MKRKNILIVWLLAFALFISALTNGGTQIYAEAAGKATEAPGYVTLSVEKFVLGQGYLKEPIKVQIEEDDNGASLLIRALGEGNYTYSGSIESSFYLTGIRDAGEMELFVPGPVADAVNDKFGEFAGKAEAEWLSGFDYTPEGGWVTTVNDEFQPFGFSDYIPQDGDVIRTQFTVYGYGADLGGGWDGNVLEPADRAALTKTVATINSSPDKDNLLALATLKTAYDEAYRLLTDLESGHADLVHAHDVLVDALKELQDDQSPPGNNKHLSDLFKDAEEISPWAYAALDEAVRMGYIEGSNGLVRPQSSVTRAEFAKIITAAFELEISAQGGRGFTDVAATDWPYPYVSAVLAAGIMNGYNGKFDPNAKMTREQMASTIVRALGLETTVSAAPFADWSEVSDWARSDVQTVAALELMTGFNGRFNPKDAVTREMAIAVAARVKNYKMEQGEESGGDENGAGEETIVQTVQKQIADTALFLQETVVDPIVASIGGEWTVLGLARSGELVPEHYYEQYYANVEQTLKEKSGKLHHVKYTEYDRVILALTAIGKSVDDVAGYNLREPLADYDTLIKQGINGPIFALIALDSNNYEIPIVTDVTTQTTRELLIAFILKREIAGGGWSLDEKSNTPDPDITAMAIQGLTPYYGGNADVAAAVNRGVAWLSRAQHNDGGFASWGSVNAESAAQVIVALTGLGIDPHSDARFVKNGRSALDALLGYAAPNGGFYHIKAGGIDNGGGKPGEVDLMAADQAMYALVAYDRFVKGHKRLYDMTDAASKQ